MSRPNWKTTVASMRAADIVELRNWLDIPPLVKDAVPIIRAYLLAEHPDDHWESKQDLLEQLGIMGHEYMQANDGRKMNMQAHTARAEIKREEQMHEATELMEELAFLRKERKQHPQKSLPGTGTLTFPTNEYVPSDGEDSDSEETKLLKAEDKKLRIQLEKKRRSKEIQKKELRKRIEDQKKELEEE
jgi:hypothetical protein